MPPFPDPETMQAGIRSAINGCGFEAIHRYMDTRPRRYWRGAKEVPKAAEIRAFAEDLARSAAANFKHFPLGRLKEPHGFCASGGLEVTVFADRTEITYGKSGKKDRRAFPKDAPVAPPVGPTEGE
jgi:hypothetical protein